MTRTRTLVTALGAAAVAGAIALPVTTAFAGHENTVASTTLTGKNEVDDMSDNRIVGDKNGRVEVTANVRMPRGKTPDALRGEIAGKINAWATANHVALEINHDQGNWMARDPKGAWLSTLLNIYGDTTGLDAKPVPTAGSTTAKLMPNAINFGPAMPGKKYTAHNANEYKEVPDLNLDMQMFTEMLVRIGNLPSMQ